MDNVSAFLALPSEQVLKILTIEQLRKVAEHYKIDADIPRSVRKVELFQRVSEKLSEMDVISVNTDPESVVPKETSTSREACLTFEEQKALLELQDTF